MEARLAISATYWVDSCEHVLFMDAKNASEVDIEQYIETNQL